jgi:hypothetical protein
MRVRAAGAVFLAAVLLTQQLACALQVRSSTGPSKYASKGLMRTQDYTELM